MIRTTPLRLRRGEHSGEFVYVVRDPDGVPLYVGASRSLTIRFRQHVSRRGLSVLRHFRPGSMDWPVDLLAVEECRGAVDEHALSVHGYTFPLVSLARAERAIIWKLAPAINSFGAREGDRRCVSRWNDEYIASQHAELRRTCELLVTPYRGPVR